MGAQAGDDLLSQLTGILEGRAAATFVVLAGIGLGLAGGRNINRTISVTTRRAVFLLLLGLANTLVFDADIIHYYAFYFFFGMLFLPFGSRLLLVGILLLNILFVILILTLDYEASWNWEDYSYADFWTPSGFVRNLFFNGWHPVIPWLGFLLFGVVLSRAPLSERSTQRNIVVGGVLTIAIAEGLSAVISPALASIDAELAIFGATQPLPPMPLYSLAGIGAACTVVGLCLMISRWTDRAWHLAGTRSCRSPDTDSVHCAHPCRHGNSGIAWDDWRPIHCSSRHCSGIVLRRRDDLCAAMGAVVPARPA